MCPSWDDLCFALPIVGTNVEMSPSYDPEYSPKLTLVTSDSMLATSAKAKIQPIIFLYTVLGCAFVLNTFIPASALNGVKDTPLSAIKDTHS